MTTVLVLLLTVAGCSGIKPWKAPNHREDGPKGGLFSGPEGAWTIGVGGTPAAPPPATIPVPAAKQGDQ